MTQDHYAVLGIPVTADLAAIKKAYRAKAAIAHPDHGGSHEVMLRINEAREILSDPVLRQHYDEARADHLNQAAQQQAQADAAKARQQAEHYPRDWTDFDSWLAKDFAEAEYGQWGWLPTVSKSHTGIVFIVIGLIIGTIAAVILYQNDNTDKWPLWTPFLGAGIGQWIHKQIGKSMRNLGGPSTTNSASKSSAGVNRPVAETSAPDKGIGYAVIAGIIAFIVLIFLCQITLGDGIFSEQETYTNWPGVFIGTGIVAFIAYQIGKS